MEKQAEEHKVRKYALCAQLPDSIGPAEIYAWSIEAINKIFAERWQDIKGSPEPPQLGVKMQHHRPVIDVPGCTVRGRLDLEAFIVIDAPAVVPIQ